MIRGIPPSPKVPRELSSSWPPPAAAGSTVASCIGIIALAWIAVYGSLDPDHALGGILAICGVLGVGTVVRRRNGL